MRSYVAANGDTLRTIANKSGIELERLLSINPHIPSTDVDIGKKKVNIPSPPQRVPRRKHTLLPPCPHQVPEEFQDYFIPLTPLDEMAQTDYDVIVVGTGAGGGAATWRLCEQLWNTDKKIGVVEAGPILLQTHASNLPTLTGRWDNYFFNPKISRPIGQFLPDLPGARDVIALGGRTLFWGRTSPRMFADEWDNYPIDKKELELYYNIAEQMMTVSKPTDPLSYTYLTRLWENGFPEASINPRALNLEPVKYGPVVNFSSISFLASALIQRPFDLAVNARAVKIFTEQGKATGIKVMTPEMKSYTLKAKNIILSASAFETPRLLLSSGIKGEAIGHYLTIHSYLKSSYQVSRPLNDAQSHSGMVDLFIPQTENRPYQLQIEILEGDKTQNKLAEPVVESHNFGKVEPRYENMLFLNPYRRDKYGVPEFQVHFAYSAKDKSIISELNYSINKAANSIGATSPPKTCLSAPGSAYHTMGTCRMGDDPSTSATNRYGQVHHVSGLYVADNSILPNTGAANPTLTTVALAIRTADYITRKLD
ncbi:GMC oxidoreductase [Gracilibacillus sp. YIM 98692]|uniref:GMC oxidoreductase n=1 Tax=Gracilibacillus sp. YIM 98692 TaxID=2663532 RepID=UPI0013D64ECD|nr:GMC oxidoreductase [Gracilibacillus sp. YIM 98692]